MDVRAITANVRLAVIALTSEEEEEEEEKKKKNVANSSPIMYRSILSQESKNG